MKCQKPHAGLLRSQDELERVLGARCRYAGFSPPEDGWRGVNKLKADTCPGFCSDSYLKTMSSPSGIPFSIVADNVFSSLR